MTGRESIFLFEAHSGSLARTTGLIERLGYAPATASTTEEAMATLERTSPAMMIVAHSPAGVEIGHYIRDFTQIETPLAALIGQSDDGSAIVAEMSADGYLRRPCSSGALESWLSLAPRLRTLRADVRALEQRVILAEQRLNASAELHTLDSIRDLLAVEVRRAKRYGYPISVMMVGLDPTPALDQIERPRLQRDITAALSTAITKSLRVIDLPIHYADDRILVFLPHTDLEGAEEVGRRIKRRIKRITLRSTGSTAQLTASVGLAGLGTGDKQSFSRLVKSAAAALKAAQLTGGDKVMKRTLKRATSDPAS